MDISGILDIDSRSSKAIIKLWERTLMDLRSSTFTCTQTFGWNDDVISGNHLNPTNTLGWDKVVLNLLVDRG